jgi:hypothetical protein
LNYIFRRSQMPFSIRRE